MVSVNQSLSYEAPPSLSNSLVEMNTLIDDKLASDNYPLYLFAGSISIKNKKRKVLTLVELCAFQIIKNEDLLQQVPGLKEDLQIILLKNVQNVSEWTKVRAYCTDKAIQNSAKAYIKRLHLTSSVFDRLFSLTAEKKFLSHVFRQILACAKENEIERIIEISENNLHPITAKVRRTQTSIERMAGKVSNFILHPVTQVCLPWVSFGVSWCTLKYLFYKIDLENRLYNYAEKGLTKTLEVSNRAFQQSSFAPRVNEALETNKELVEQIKAVSLNIYPYLQIAYYLSSITIRIRNYRFPHPTLSKIISILDWMYNSKYRLSQWFSGMQNNYINQIAQHISVNTNVMTVQTGQFLQTQIESRQLEQLTRDLITAKRNWLSEIQSQTIKWDSAPASESS